MAQGCLREKSENVGTFGDMACDSEKACTESSDSITNRLWARVLLSSILIPNAPFWIAACAVNVRPRGYISVEYIGWGIMLLFLPRWFVGSGIALSLFADVLRLSAFNFYFRYQDVVSSLRYLRELPTANTVPIGCVLLVGVLGVVYVVLKVAPKVPRAQCNRIGLVMLIVAMVPISVDMAYGRLDVRQGEKPRVRLGSASGINLLGWTFRTLVTNAGIDFRPVPSATAEMLVRLRAGNGLSGDERNVVLVLVESYGQLHDVSQAHELLSPYASAEVQKRYAVHISGVPFSGATVAGEFRELCGLSSGTVRHPDRSQMGQCLPALLKNRKYSLVSFHGFTRRMFDRKFWYSELGFERSFFREDLDGLSGVRVCEGGLPGICDGDIAQLIGDMLARESSQLHFVHWVTLNSHLPVKSVRSRVFQCDARVAGSEICDWADIVYRLNLAVAALATRPDVPPTEFIVVGDHAPPFGLESRRNLFSQEEVPYIHLIPKPVTAGAGRNPLQSKSAQRPAELKF